MKESEPFRPGDWVKSHTYGIGQVLTPPWYMPHHELVRFGDPSEARTEYKTWWVIRKALVQVAPNLAIKNKSASKRAILAR